MESVFNAPQIILWVFLIAGVLAILFSIKRDLFIVFGFCVLFLLLGVLRMQIAEFNVLNDKLSQFNDSEEEVVLEGTIIKEPDARDSSQKIKVKIDGYNSIILVTTSKYPEYQYSDRVKITGKLQTPIEGPKEYPDFSYKNYLLKDGIYSVMYFPKTELLGQAKQNLFSFIYSCILLVKEKLRASIQNNFLPPNSSLLEGVILGDKNAISQDIKDKFRITGLSHVIAVSGMHVVILSAIIMYFLLAVGLWRKHAFFAALIFILTYVLLVGAPPSAVRAGIMGGIYLLATNIGRQVMSTRIIVLAAGIMLLFNPLLLFYDVGFQLSFLAVLGLIYLEPLIRNFIKFLTKGKFEKIIMLFSATMSAQIFTLPVIIFNFGSVSLVAPVTNVLLLPAVPAIMFFGFLSSVAGIIFVPLGWILSLPCYFLLEYFFWVVNIFSGTWAYKIIENVSGIWVFVAYFLLAVITRYFYKKTPLEL